MVRIEKLRSRFIRFMYGRYGVDQLYKAMFGVVIFIMVINLFIQSSVMNGIIWLLLLLASFRVFSKNIYKRQVENSRYLKVEKAVRKELKFNLRRIKEFRSYRFRKCPNCHQVLRLKRKPGKHKTSCPKCNTELNVRIIL